MATPTPAPVRKPRGRQPAQAPAGLATRLKELRLLAGISQEAVGAQGFVSAPGWIKIENGQRSPSENLLAAFVGWLVEEKHVLAGHRAALIEELTAIKYAQSKNSFLAQLARDHLAGLKK